MKQDKGQDSSEQCPLPLSLSLSLSLSPTSLILSSPPSILTQKFPLFALARKSITLAL